MRSNFGRVLMGVWLISAGVLDSILFVRNLLANEGTVSGWEGLGTIAGYILLFIIIIFFFAIGIYRLMEAWKKWK